MIGKDFKLLVIEIMFALENQFGFQIQIYLRKTMLLLCVFLKLFVL